MGFIAVSQHFQRDSLVSQPLTIGTLGGNAVLELFVRDQSTLFKVQQEHTAWLQTAFFFDVGRINLNHTHFRGHDDLVVVSDIVAAGTQAVTVEYGTNVVAIREYNRGRAIPGLHQRAVEFVEVLLVLRHVDV